MKKSFLSLLVSLFFVGLAHAQDDGAKLAKSAGKALTSYNIDPSGNAEKLMEAREKIDRALQTPEAQAIASAWITKGDIYNTIVQKDMIKRTVDPKAGITGDNPALEAFNAYKKGYELAEKKYEKADAIKGIMENLQGNLINIGAMKYDAKEYDKAYASFHASIQSHELLNAAKEKSILDDPKQLTDQMYFTAVAAQLAGKNAEAMAYYQKLVKSKETKAEFYDGLYNCTLATGDEAAAKSILEEARQKFPDDSGLLFAEINAYLKAGRLNELTDRLKLAISKEPNNTSLYVTLGSVYDNLYQKALEAKDEKATNENFSEAKKYYLDALAKDPKNVDATYSMGALYYNKAAFRTKELNAMPEDYTSAGVKKYDAAKKEIMDLFEESLPYFQKAESFDPNDMNTLIALKEIYTRKEDDLALEFKKRLDTVAGGGKNAGSYFKN